MQSGKHYDQDLKDIHTCLHAKELLENALNQQKLGSPQKEAVVSPISAHEVTKEYRTKMTDWMVEVCTSFKCSERTYFLAVQIFD